jgi:hypothetical protein
VAALASCSVRVSELNVDLFVRSLETFIVVGLKYFDMALIIGPSSLDS